MKIYIASDHAGVELKSKILMKLQGPENAKLYETFDLGPNSTDSVDYPDYADLVCKKLHGLSVVKTDDQEKSLPSELGILICGSGQGMNMRANKYPQIRAALCWNLEIAKLSREHNDANILCLGARVIDHDLALAIVNVFLKTSFAGGRHRQRLVKLSNPV